MEALFDDFSLLKADFAQNPYPSVRERREWLKALDATIRQRQDDLFKAASEDFGRRSASETRILELLPTLEQIRYTLTHLSRWMRPERRHVGLLFQPARNFVCYQPKGVVGVIVPWNYPIFLAFGPVITALAAGNKVMVKLSEYTPALNHVIREIIKAALPHQVRIVEGDAAVAAQFSQLPFDHLLYTGSTAVGYQVMKAASQNLTPVTLELGGKSPLIWADAPLSSSLLDRLIFGKTANAGQTCVAPDYLLLVKKDLPAFIQALSQRLQHFYPQGTASEQWTSIINTRHFKRLENLLQQAKDSGATLTPLMAHQELPPELATTTPSHLPDVQCVTAANPVSIDGDVAQPSIGSSTLSEPMPTGESNDPNPTLPTTQPAPQLTQQPQSVTIPEQAPVAPCLLPLTLVTNAPLDCALWHEELFGPILPVHLVDNLEQALSFVAERPRPLALYLFSHSAKEQQKVLSHSHSGGVCLNDTLVHVGQDDLPFGGIGPSGMGHYHGREGFLTFSHHKAVHMKGRVSTGFMAYPHQRIKLLDKLLDWWLR